MNKTSNTSDPMQFADIEIMHDDATNATRISREYTITELHLHRNYRYSNLHVYTNIRMVSNTEKVSL